MEEFLRLCIAPATLPFTVMLVCVFMYWILCIVGAVGLDMFDIEMDADLDGVLDVDVDVDLDIDIDVDADVDMDADVDADMHGIGHGGGYFIALLKFMNVGEVPTMILASVLIFCIWAGSLILNSNLNPAGKVSWTLLLLIPNWIISMIATKVLTAPFRAIFKRAKDGVASPTKIVGRTCRITTQKVTASSGQAELCHDEEDATPITLNVRSRDGEQLGKGDEVLVVEHDDESNTYFVVPL